MTDDHYTVLTSAGEEEDDEEEEEEEAESEEAVPHGGEKQRGAECERVAVALRGVESPSAGSQAKAAIPQKAPD